MLILATGLPHSRVEQGRIVLSVPSGAKDKVEIALTVNQALHAAQGLRMVAVDAMQLREAEADIIQFAPKPRAGKR